MRENVFPPFGSTFAEAPADKQVKRYYTQKGELCVDSQCSPASPDQREGKRVRGLIFGQDMFVVFNFEVQLVLGFLLSQAQEEVAQPFVLQLGGKGGI